MKEVWHIGDLHLGDMNIIRYESRPFKTVEEMDDVITTNWNNAVGDDDIVFIHGDVSSYDKEKTKSIISNLKGYKILIMGNHDKEKGDRNYFLEIGFDEVIMFPIAYNEFFWLSHEPMYVNDNMPYVNIHGHTHNNSFDNIRYVNVSVEKIGYTPLNHRIMLRDRFGKVA